MVSEQIPTCLSLVMVGVLVNRLNLALTVNDVGLCTKITWSWSLTPMKGMYVSFGGDGPQSSSLKQGNQGEVINTLTKVDNGWLCHTFDIWWLEMNPGMC